MLDRYERWLKIGCLLLGVALMLQLLRLAAARDPLEDSGMALTSDAFLAPGSSNASTPARSERSPGSSPGIPAPVPPPVQSRIDKIKESEIFGAIAKPLPMALLGIGGPDAFLRAPDGQTGLLRVGETLGGVKLLQIGTNRVLIEHEGERKELTLFSGFGSESLLPK